MQPMFSMIVIPACYVFTSVCLVRHFLTEQYNNWFCRYLVVSPSGCRHFQWLGFLMGAPTTNFARKRIKTRYLTLFRSTKNSVVICRASLLYEMSESFRSTLFVPTDFRDIFPPNLRWGWVFLERMQILSAIQFTTYVIEIFVVETKQFVGSILIVILARQTCGQRSSRARESKRRAPGNYFSEWICYMFVTSKCRGDWDLGLCTFWVLAKREPLCNANFRKKMCFARRKNQNLALCSGSLFASTQKVHRPRSQSPVHFDIRNI